MILKRFISISQITKEIPVYSVGYREAVLDYLDNGHTYREACKEFKINCATLCNWVKRKRELDSLEANYQGRKSIINLEELKKYVDANPDAYQYEIAEEFHCAQSTICYNLNKLGYTFKKKPSDIKSKMPQK